MTLERNGYEDASDYPLWYLQERFARLSRHLKAEIKTQAAMTMSAVAATKGKRAHQAFKQMLEKM